MNRMKAADITQLCYLFDMCYCVFYNKTIIENPAESIFTDDRNEKIDSGFSIIFLL